MSRTIHTVRFDKVKPLRITKLTVEKLGAKHNNGKHARRLHLIFQTHKFGFCSWALLIGLEGRGIRCDGWWKARVIKAYRKAG